MVLRGLFLVALPTSLNLGSAFLLPFVHQAVLPDTSTAIVRHQHDTDSRSVLLAAAPTAAGGSSSTATAKKSFLENLERKRAGEDVTSSVFSADLHVLRSAPTQPSTTTTTVDNTGSWKGTWEICYAPHIQTLAKVILTEFPSVLYNFVSDDGRMVSHSRYESKVFGSGWFNADGRVVVLPASDGGTSEAPQQTVVFERFWWDRSGEDRPTGAPPGSSATPVDGFVQAAGKAMFFDGLSVFPVHYLDDDFCVFEFKAAGTVVASQRIA
ncbi:unnamed protein product [Ectocarpus fasciculatus]